MKRCEPSRSARACLRSDVTGTWRAEASRGGFDSLRRGRYTALFSGAGCRPARARNRRRSPR
jgi:hypothetical protein